MFGVRKRIAYPNTGQASPQKPVIPTITYISIPLFGECHCALLDWLVDTINPQYPDLDELDLQAPRYVPASLDILTKTTRFSRREIQLIYRSFKQECPTGIVTAEKFRELYSQFFPLGDASYFARQIFQLMDQDMDGSVTFEEYLVVMSMLSRGSLDEKVQWVFNLYDSNGEGQLTAEKLTDVAVSVYEMLGSYTDPPWINETTIKDHVARVFSKMDTNQDGIVTFTEFKEFCITVSIREARLRGAPL
ncbi:hypothetical protein RvY_15664-6 [Ramazzottius varieornatus]|uniref:EF-hand domain-containing protein n=1 Tax=Ramazzottius varieornatus TaxID=947166 RepID=A0A1D1VVQ5_RAMVA|nr:hypothetical protein RvY_15664-6 [Ramazzottius varieornatus]